MVEPVAAPLVAAPVPAVTGCSEDCDATAAPVAAAAAVPVGVVPVAVAEAGDLTSAAPAAVLGAEPVLLPVATKTYKTR